MRVRISRGEFDAVTCAQLMHARVAISLFRCECELRDDEYHDSFMASNSAIENDRIARVFELAIVMLRRRLRDASASLGQMLTAITE